MGGHSRLGVQNLPSSSGLKPWGESKAEREKGAFPSGLRIKRKEVREKQRRTSCPEKEAEQSLAQAAQSCTKLKRAQETRCLGPNSPKITALCSLWLQGSAEPWQSPSPKPQDTWWFELFNSIILHIFIEHRCPVTLIKVLTSSEQKAESQPSRGFHFSERRQAIHKSIYESD